MMIIYILLLRFMAVGLGVGVMLTATAMDWINALMLGALSLISLGVAAGLESVALTEHRLEALTAALKKRKASPAGKPAPKDLAPNAPNNWVEFKAHPVKNTEHARYLARRGRRLSPEEAQQEFP